MNNSVVLSIGDTYHLRFGKDCIVYAGMPSENVFSNCTKEMGVLLPGLFLESLFPQRSEQYKN